MHKSREPLTSSKALQPVTTIFGLKLFIFTFFSILVFRSAREASDRIMTGLQSGYATCAKDTAPSGLAARGTGSAQQPARQSAEGEAAFRRERWLRGLGNGQVSARAGFLLPAPTPGRRWGSLSTHRNQRGQGYPAVSSFVPHASPAASPLPHPHRHHQTGEGSAANLL